MKINKLLTPILSIASLGAIVSPLTVLTSCGNGGGGGEKTTQFTVSFNTQGGSTIADVKVNKDSTVTKPTDPTKTNFVFNDWYKEAQCINKFDFNTKITSNITLYAKWDADVSKEYECEVEPKVFKEKFETKEAALNTYIDAVNGETSNEKDYKILKDDARFAYAKAFKTENFKKVSTLESYTLDFPEVSLDKANKKMGVTFHISVSGTFKDWYYDDHLTFTDGHFDCWFKMDQPFDIEFCEADDTTCEKLNYIKCSGVGYTAKYKLVGSCKMLDGTIHTANRTEWTNFDLSKPVRYVTEQEDGYVAYQLVINGLTCNAKTPSEYGVLYTNYMSLAEIK